MPPPRRLSEAEARDLAPYVRRLIAAKYRWVPDHLASEDDLFQYAMLGVARAAPRFDPAHGMSFRTWGLTKAGFAIQDALRVLAPGSRRGQALVTVSLDEPLPGAEDATRADVIEDDFEFSDPLQTRCLEHAMRSLTLDEQSAIALRFDEDLPLNEIGVMMGVTESRVSQFVTSGLAKLRRHPALAA